MELINNTTKTLKDDLSVEIKQGSKLSIAAACFSIYSCSYYWAEATGSSTKKKRQNSDIQNFNDEPNIRVDN